MKKFFAIFTAVILMPVSQTMAWTGGPFSNNSPLPGGDDGVYEAVATMSNGVGIYRFAVRNNGVSSQAAGGAAISSNLQFNAGVLLASSSNIWFYKGITYYGTAFGMANSDMGIVSAVGNATTNVGGAAAAAPGQPVLPSINGAIIAGPSGNNIGFANSSWVAKMQDKGPAFRFSGRGQINFSGASDVIASVEAINPVTIAAGGVFTPVVGIGGGTGAGSVALPGNSLVTTSNQVNSTSTSAGGGTLDGTATATQSEVSFNSYSRVGTGGEDGDFQERGHARKFIVFGTKVSHTVSP